MCVFVHTPNEIATVNKCKIIGNCLPRKYRNQEEKSAEENILQSLMAAATMKPIRCAATKLRTNWARKQQKKNKKIVATKEIPASRQ